MAAAPKKSLADFNTRTAPPFRFEYTLPDKSGSGVFFSVYSDNSDPVTAVRNAMIDATRAQDAAQVAALASAKPGDIIPPKPFAKDVEEAEQLDAARVAGWDGVDDAFSPEAALALMHDSPDIRLQVRAKSMEMGNFIRRSSKTS